ncbi:sugar transferase [Nocardioides faecalis]|uniref:sugar transferase n=1 Tax=Nocardioides faecalis TaxID=2803858 RepID=UPI0027DB591E|nr:sugar transferase [Nocardioides faecalis]
MSLPVPPLRPMESHTVALRTATWLHTPGSERTLAAPVPRVAVLPEPRIRRLLDVLIALLTLSLLLPLLVALALAVRLSSRGPVLYRQVRIGAGGVPITVLKFRSMTADAESRRAALEVHNERSGPLFKMRHDPRVTPVGRWMRRFSLDELPQLLNVLSGSMSLVGPRPALPAEAACFDLHAARRHAVRPGLTGLAQVSGRSDLPWDSSLQLDLQYVERRTLRLDAHILLRTVPAVLLARGAY